MTYEALLFDDRDTSKDPAGEFPPDSLLGLYDTAAQAKTAIDKYRQDLPDQWEYVTHAAVVVMKTA